MEFKHCNTCDEDKPLSEFYFNKTRQKYYYKCKLCDNEHKRKKRMKDVYISGMANTITQKPNTYKDDIQKAETFQIMERLGWKFNKSNGVWYNDVIKDKDGKWLVKFKEDKKKKYPKRKFSLTRAESNKKRRFLPIEKLPKLNVRDESITEEIERKILIAYFHYCYSFQEIVKMYPEINDRKIFYIITRGNTLITRNGTRTNR